MIVALSAALVAGTAYAQPGGPGPGNSPNAKKCQKDGWRDLTREDGSAFASQQECMSYAAMGGTLTEINHLPLARDDSYTVNEDTPLAIAAAAGVLANDTDPDGDPLTAVLVSAPAHGTLTFNANGSFAYTPDVDFNGTDSFTYTANDDRGGVDTATVEISVNPVNDPPVALNDNYATNEDKQTDGNVLVNDTDVDGDPLNAVLLSEPSNGTLTFNADGSFTYTPHRDFNGTDSFTYTANDGAADSNVATVTIFVEPVPV